MSLFNQFGDCYGALQTGIQENIDQATQLINQMNQTPGFVDFLIEFIASSQSQNLTHFALTAVNTNVKKFWENDSLYKDKDQIRSSLLQLLLLSTSSEVAQNNLVTIISTIAASDYPHKWSQLMPTLTHAIETSANPPLPVVGAVLQTAYAIFQRYEFATRTDSLYTEIKTSLESWDKLTLELLTNFTASFDEENVQLTKCTESLLHIIYALNQQDLPPYYEDHMDEFFACYNQLLQVTGATSVKTQLCNIVRQYNIRYITDIESWGTKEPNIREEEAITAFRELYHSILQNVMLIVRDYAELDTAMVIAAFAALKVLAMSKQREFFIEANHLSFLCGEVLVPCVSLTQDEINEFSASPLAYFKQDIQGLEGESRKKAAYDFLKVLCRYFRTELSSAFGDLNANLLKQYEADPQNHWDCMDTALFITGIIASERVHIRDGVTEVIAGFDIDGFIRTYVLPLLTSDTNLYILQADAIKFYVDFRNVISPELTQSSFQLFINLLKSDNPSVLYASYLIEKLLDSKKIGLTPEFLSNFNLSSIATRLIQTIVYNGETNHSSARCLMRLIVTAKTALSKETLLSIVKSVAGIIKNGYTTSQDSQLYHYLFEVLAASVTQGQANISEVETVVIPVLESILQGDASDFVPYAYQILAAFLSSYPTDQTVNQFYTDSFPAFLDPTVWAPQGNVPALSLLIQAYAKRLPDIIIANIDQIFFISENLLGGTRTHQYIFSVFNSILRFLPEFSMNIAGQMFSLASAAYIKGTAIKYKQSFGVFVSNAAFLLGPDNALGRFGDTTAIVQQWSDSLPNVHGREELENALYGSLNTLVLSTQLSSEMWNQLFYGTIMMIEKPSNDMISEEIQVMKEEEAAAQQFDTTFSKLFYADVVNSPLHPELQGVDLIQFMATEFSKMSHSRPGVLGYAIHTVLPENLKKIFDNYQTKYGLTFE